MEEIAIGKNILSIDCALRQGSLAVTNGSSVLASAGDESGNPSRAEEILSAVETVLKTAALSLSMIDSVVVSTGPGSYSGIRIGIATAAGLSRALGIPVRGVSLLEALASKGGSTKLMSAIPIGKDDVAWQPFEMKVDGPVPVTGAIQDSEEDFIASLTSSDLPVVVVHSDLFSRVSRVVPSNIQVVKAGWNVAELLGIFAARFPSPRLSMQPIYLRNRNFSQVGF